MINANEAYIIGILLSKGSIIELDDKVRLVFRIKFRRPSDESLRSDNIHTELEARAFRESLRSKYINDFSSIITLLKDTWCMSSSLVTPDGYDISDWAMKEMIINSEPIDKHHARLCEILNCTSLDSTVLKRFPFHLSMENSPPISLSFIQGVCDGCALVPNEASSSYGGNGKPRIQIEPTQERWELPIGLCRCFQIGLGIPVANINWGHPQIRNSWKGQNHQFRVYLENIPEHIELFRLQYKRDEYRSLYRRQDINYVEGKMCPYKKRIQHGETINLSTSASDDLNSELLDNRLKGISVDIKNKKSLIVCKLLGCTQCEDYFYINK